jgi:hypothetical protein
MDSWDEEWESIPRDRIERAAVARASSASGFDQLEPGRATQRAGGAAAAPWSTWRRSKPASRTSPRGTTSSAHV